MNSVCVDQAGVAVLLPSPGVHRGGTQTVQLKNLGRFQREPWLHTGYA